MARFKASSSKRRGGNAQEPDREQGSASVSKITSASDAGFIGEDAFANGSDQITLEPGYVEGYSRYSNTAADLLDDTEEVLHLRNTEDSGKARKRGRTIAADSPPPVAAESSSKKRKRHDRNKELVPLESKVSRFQANSRSKTSIQADDNTASESDESDNEVNPAMLTGSVKDGSSSDADEQDNDGDWARAGGYHVSRREILRDEARDAKSKGRLIDADEDRAQREVLELQESLRIQAQARSLLTESDYIYAIDNEQSTPSQGRHVLSVVAPKADIIHTPAELPALSRDESIARLLDQQPELLALLDDLSNVQDRLSKSRQYVLGLERDQNTDQSLPKAFARLYCDLLSSYALNLSFFIHLKTHPSHPKAMLALTQDVTAQLVRLRTAIKKVEEMDLFDLPGDEAKRNHYGAASGLQDELSDTDADFAFDMEQGLFDNQDASDETDVTPVEASSTASLPSKKRRRRSTGKQKGVTGEDPARLLKLDDILSESGKTHSRAADTAASQTIAGNDYIESEKLSSADAEEKGRRRNSLRFHTSKIESQSARRADARRSRQGGDDDVPYRSKERARAAVLQRQQHGNSDASSKHDDMERDLADLASVGKSTVDEANDTEYYDLVVNRKKASDLDKRDEYAVAVQQNRDETTLYASSDPNGPRAVNRQIMANKGLTPKRAKAVRNPRVKKRMRFEKAQQKSASMKPVYKAGAASSAYQGEKSGISSRVVKSRAL